MKTSLRSCWVPACGGQRVPTALEEEPKRKRTVNGSASAEPFDIFPMLRMEYRGYING